jgi:hypothetical protein
MTGGQGVARFSAGPAPAGVSILLRLPAGREEEAHPVTMIAVQPPPRESDLRRDDAAHAQFWAACGIDSAEVRRLTPGTTLTAEVTESRFGMELWHFLFMFALILALVESVVARESGKTEATP